jgi:hypothetical protein
MTDALINLMDKTLEAKVHLKMPKTASLPYKIKVLFL